MQSMPYSRRFLQAGRPCTIEVCRCISPTFSCKHMPYSHRSSGRFAVIPRGWLCVVVVLMAAICGAVFAQDGSYFFTVVTHLRAPFLCDVVARDILRGKIRECQESWPFEINAWVLLPDHLHTIWSLPPGDQEYSKRWGWIKKEFTSDWLASGGPERKVTVGKQRQRRRGVWQPRFWEHLLMRINRRPSSRRGGKGVVATVLNCSKNANCGWPDWPYSAPKYRCTSRSIWAARCFTSSLGGV